MKKRIISFILAITMLFTLIISCQFTSAVSDENFIDEQTANALAVYFIAQSSETDNSTKWSFEEITDTIYTPLYDKNNDIIAHCFDIISGEDNSGYVIISASKKTNLILEFADEGKSVYLKKNDEGFKTIYNNSFDVYFERKGLMRSLFNDTVISRNNEEIKKSELNDALYEKEEYETANRDLLNTVSSLIKNQPQTRSGFTYDRIVDNVSYLQTYYSSKTYTANYWKTLESRIGHYTMNYPGTEEVLNEGHCGITAICNVLMSWRNICCSKFPSQYKYLFNTTALVANTNDWFFAYYHENNLPAGYHTGIYGADIHKIANATFKHYGYNNSLCQYVPNVNWTVMKNEIDYDRPFVLLVQEGSYTTYGNHFVAVYAYSSFISPQNTQVRFLKVANGWDSYGVYIDYNSFVQYGGEARAEMAKILPY